jgi:transcriptional regulator with XRE-family HTH domain
MRWDFGQIYKSIRLGKGLSQKDVCHDQINRTTLSRIENDNQNTSFESMQYLLDQINVSWDEFQYICNEFQPSFRDEIINEYYTIVSTAEIEKISKLKRKSETYLKSSEDNKIREIHYILAALSKLETDSPAQITSTTKKLVSLVWDRLSKIDIWTYDDIRLINAILYHLEFTTILQLVPKLRLSLQKYTAYTKIDVLQTTLLINLAYIYMQNNLLPESKTILEEALLLAKKLNRVDFIGISMVRLGICSNNRKQREDGLSLLNLVGHSNLIVELTKEIDTFNLD